MAVFAGLAAGLLAIGLVQLIDPHLPLPLHRAVTTATSGAWHGLLASFYGAIGEEILVRLFLMTLLVWLFARFAGKAPTPTVYWTAIALAALAFGAGHLPAAAQVWPLDAVVVGRTILVNAAAGLVFGWLYWRRGLEVAMLAHFSADLVLHVGAPLLSGLTP
jgi:membrane protease YdiL (CAAX protease family)